MKIIVKDFCERTLKNYTIRIRELFGESSVLEEFDVYEVKKSKYKNCELCSWDIVNKNTFDIFIDAESEMKLGNIK
jgi:hypothetical protein